MPLDCKMKINRNLKEIVLASSVILSGCDAKEEVFFDQVVDGERIRYYLAGDNSEIGHRHDLVMEVSRTNKEKISYVDVNGDFKVDYLRGNTGISFEDDPACPCNIKEYWPKVQLQFDDYLSKIKKREPTWKDWFVIQYE